MVLILLSIPSALPIPATGISTPIGIVIFLIACQMIAGKKRLWLPQRVNQIRVSKKMASRIIGGLSTALHHFEKIIRPRFLWIQSSWGHRYVGVLVALLSLAMQMPIPLTNTLPAMMIFSLSLCLTEVDGLLGIFAGVLSTLVILAYLAGFAAILFFGFEGLEQVLDYLRANI